VTNMFCWTADELFTRRCKSLIGQSSVL